MIYLTYVSDCCILQILYMHIFCIVGVLTFYIFLYMGLEFALNRARERYVLYVDTVRRTYIHTYMLYI